MRAFIKPLLQRMLPAIVIAVALAGGASSASADTGTQRFRTGFEGPFREAVSTDWPVRANGVINDAGVQKVVSEEPGSTPGTIVVVTDFVFAGGSLTLHFNTTIDKDEYFGPNRCYNATAASGTYEIVGGTGRFAGASGAGTGRSHGTLFVPASGDGCDFTRCRLVSHIELTGSIDIPNETWAAQAA